MMKEYTMSTSYKPKFKLLKKHLEKAIRNRDVEFIRIHKDEISWDLVTTGFIFTVDELREFKDYIKWEYFYHSTEIVTQYTFKQLEEFKGKGDWVYLFQHKSFLHNEDIIEKYSELVDWILLSRTLDCSPEFIDKYANRLEWVDISIITHLTKYTIRKFDKKIDWKLASQFQHLDEDIIEEYVDKVDWKKISQYQRLSEEFIRKHVDDLYWDLVMHYQLLSDKLIRECIVGKNYKVKTVIGEYLNRGI